MERENTRFTWKTFPDHTTETFKSLQAEEYFTDVTLVSDDHHQFKAHRVIISACSPYLKRVLLKNPHSHPLLFLRGAERSDLESILEFMYLGQISIKKYEIDMFLKIANEFELEGFNFQN